ncbi:MAG: hypothetical protein EAX96_07090 [Candidatus Lokiarchaeota archaeon]|nr:hypothetical protein [Candidatus Lokiarchaeota archaeon]
MGKKKDKKKKSIEKEGGEEETIDTQGDKQLFEDIFGVSIEEIKEEEDEKEKYDDILEKLDEIREETSLEVQLDQSVVEPDENLEYEVVEKDPIVQSAIKVLQKGVEIKPIPDIDNLEEFKENKDIIPEIKAPTRSVVTPIEEKQKINVTPLPQVKKISDFSVKTIQSVSSKIENDIIIEKVALVKPVEIVPTPLERIKMVSSAPGVIKPISFNTDGAEEPINKPIKVVEPQPGFKTVKLFIDDEEIKNKNKEKEELSEIRCGNCGVRITKKAELSLKEGWIINCKACGNQIIHN